MVQYPRHPLIMLLLAPVWGGLFVISLPIIGFYLVGYALVTGLFRVLTYHQTIKLKS